MSIQNEQVIWKKVNRLPLSYLVELYESGWKFDTSGELVNPNDQPLSQIPLQVKLKPHAKGHLRFKLQGQPENPLTLLYQNIGIFVDHQKIGVASIQPDSNDQRRLQATFNINKKLLLEIAKRHDLRLLINDVFYLVPSRVLLKVLTEEEQQHETTGDYYALFSQGYLLNKKSWTQSAKR